MKVEEMRIQMQRIWNLNCKACYVSRFSSHQRNLFYNLSTINSKLLTTNTGGKETSYIPCFQVNSWPLKEEDAVGSEEEKVHFTTESERIK